MERQIDDTTLIKQSATADFHSWEAGYVLKLFLRDYPASLIDREIAGTRAANAAGVPSPRLEDIVTVAERRGLVLERVRGQTMLSVLGQEPAHALRYAVLFAELQSQIHDCHVSELPSYREDIARRVARAGVAASIRSDALAMLERLPDGDMLCHGDLHPDNVLLTDRGPCIIDWSFAGAGQPLADAAQTALLLRIADPPAGAFRVAWVERETRERFYKGWLTRYRQLRPDTGEQMWNWLLPAAVARLAEGIPAEKPRLVALIDKLHRKP